jgi:hypothetical protein
MESKSNTREIKYRVWNDRYKEFSYWGFIDNTFKGPPTGSGLSIEECKNLSQQFTGLKDSKGVDIFEGDVDKILGVCVWNHESCEYGFESDEGYASLTIHTPVEIVGHIYQTPNL